MPTRAELLTSLHFLIAGFVFGVATTRQTFLGFESKSFFQFGCILIWLALTSWFAPQKSKVWYGMHVITFVLIAVLFWGI